MVLVGASIIHTVKAGDPSSHTPSTLEGHTLPLPQPSLSWASRTVDHLSHVVSALSSHDPLSLQLIFLLWLLILSVVCGHAVLLQPHRDLQC